MLLEPSWAIDHVNVELSMSSQQRILAQLFAVKSSNLIRYQKSHYSSSLVVVTSQKCLHHVIFQSSKIRELIVVFSYFCTGLKSYAASSWEVLVPIRLTLITIKTKNKWWFSLTYVISTLSILRVMSDSVVRYRQLQYIYFPKFLQKYSCL
jgi:hypothetical protein